MKTGHALRASLIALALTTAPARAERAQLPEILDCAVMTNANWISGGIVAGEYREATGYAIHLNTRTGEWYLSNAYAASLTMDGGNYAILRDGTEYPFRWIGLDDDGATQLRIELTRAPEYPFLFIDHHNALMAGKCAVPDKVFIFLDR